MLIRRPVATVFEAFVNPEITSRFWFTKGSGRNGKSTEVEWTFTPREDHTTFVGITHTGFDGDGDELVKQAISSTEGFALVLSGLKAFLEHNIMLNVVADRFPKGATNP